jgi:hypothetical protein
MLADIAFVRLRHGLDPALLQGKSSFTTAVRHAQKSLGPAHLFIDVEKRLIIAQGTPIKLIPADLAFYLWLLHRQTKGLKAPQCPSDGAPEMEYASEYLKQYRRIVGEMGGTDRTHCVLEKGMTKTFFEQRKSRINKALNQSLLQAAQPYLILAEGNRPTTRYAIKLETEQISEKPF